MPKPKVAKSLTWFDIENDIGELLELQSQTYPADRPWSCVAWRSAAAAAGAAGGTKHVIFDFNDFEFEGFYSSPLPQ